MLIEERLEKIATIIEENRSATIDYLAENLSVSKDTIRRDLIKLEQKNIVRRIHGGAVLANREALIMGYQQRASQLNHVKEEIAQKVAEVVKDHSSILFDSSSTVEATISKLGNKDIHAITNSLTQAIELAKYEKTSVTLLPGKLHKEQLFLSGTETVKKIEQYNPDYTLLGVFALSEEGLFIHTEEEGLVKRQMIAQGRKVIALCDHTKMDTTGFFKICSLSEIDILITDKQPKELLMDCLNKSNVEVLLTREEE